MPVVTDDQVVSIHSIKGVQLYQFTPEDQAEMTWTRALRRVGKCDLAAPPVDDSDRFPDIVPWLHWVTVYDGGDESVLWSGPIEKARMSRQGLMVWAKDHAALLRRTDVPITKDWDNADPAWIAGELWQRMIEHHGLNIAPIVRSDPEGDRFDYSTVANTEALDVTIDALVQIGLRWNVTTGIPILGPMPLTPRATLSEADFLGADIGLLRDGSETFNSVLVRGPDALGRETVPLHGLNLQTIVMIENMFGVSNVKRAARQYARHTAGIRTALDIPSGTELHPDAPVSIRELVPSSRFVVSAHELRELVELEAVEVHRTPAATNVKVNMESVIELPELAEVIESTGQGER